MKYMMQAKHILLAVVLLLCTALANGQNGNEQYKDANPAELVKRADLSTKQLESILTYYRFQLKDEPKAKQLETLLIAKEPKGPFARLNAYQAMSRSTRPPAEQAAAAEAFLQAFPIAEWKKQATGQAFIYYSTYRVLGEAYFNSRQFDKLIQVAKTLDFKTEAEIFRWNVMRAYTFKTVRFDSLYQVATPLINDLLNKVNDTSYLEPGVFTAEKALANAREQLDKNLATYIGLLSSMGKYREVKAYFNKRPSETLYNTADLNQQYVEALTALNEKDAIQPFLEKAVRANTMTPALLETLKQQYKATHPNLDGYEAYLASLRSADEQAKMKQTVQEGLTSKEYMPFALENAAGKLVRSSDWEGKIVVLDFWATWCRPCIEAFPGMQLLVDKYKGDSAVAVYFVGTMQFGDYKEKSVNYVKSKGYRDFNLLHDAVNPKTGEQDKVFKSFVPFFHSSGIPRKVVLKDGLMRYTAEGYSGSPSQLADELSYVIDLLKAEKE